MVEALARKATVVATVDARKASMANGDKIVGLPMPQCIEMISDDSYRPLVQIRGKSRFPFPVPNGWFIVARADELAPGEKLNRNYFGRDLVVFRTKSGKARVVDAYCPHLGAHLGVGGLIQEESIKCPFHGWRFDGAGGHCVEIPYGNGAPIPKAARIRTFPTLERNRMIWAFHHLEGEPPSFDVPEVPELSDPDWTEPYFADFRIRTNCQEMAENNHDTPHFHFVHGTPDIPEESMLIEGHYKRAVARGGEFVRETFGLGLGVIRMKNVITFLSSVTPVDEDNVHVRWTFVSPKSVGEETMKRVANGYLKGVSQDIPIWENKIYRERPVLTKSEATIAQHRKWSLQFYSGLKD